MAEFALAGRTPLDPPGTTPIGDAAPLPTRDYPPGASANNAPAPITASSANAAAANNLTLPGVAGKRTFISGFVVSGGGATGASVIAITVSGVGASGTLNFALPIPAGATAAVQPLNVQFSPPLAANADNQAISLTVPSFGAGNTVDAASAWGFKL